MRRGVALVLAATFLAACVAGSSAGDGTEITIFAAASLTDIVPALAAAYREYDPGARLVASFDASSALRAQIEQGAPADVFISADEANAWALVNAHRTDGPPDEFGANPLVIVVPRSNEAGVRTVLDIGRRGVRVVAAGPDVPITGYARRLVEQIAELPEAPDDFAARYDRNVVSREDNVRAVLAKVQLGEADAAIVYATDAASTDAVTPVPIPSSIAVYAAYAAVVIRDSPRRDAAHRFVDWLTSPAAGDVLGRFGLRTPAP